MDIFCVELTKEAKKDLRKVPKHIMLNFAAWVEAVEHDGIREIRKLPGYHDEPLKGKRAGQRSVRLSRAYRAIYIEEDHALVVKVLEVNKHDY